MSLQRNVIVVVFLLVACASCARTGARSRHTERATALVTTYSPELQRLAVRFDALRSRARAIPSEVAGATELVHTLDAGAANARKMQVLLDQLPARVELAVQRERTDAAGQDIAATRAMLEGDVRRAAKTIDISESRLVELESIAPPRTLARSVTLRDR